MVTATLQDRRVLAESSGVIRNITSIGTHRRSLEEPLRNSLILIGSLLLDLFTTSVISCRDRSSNSFNIICSSIQPAHCSCSTAKTKRGIDLLWRYGRTKHQRTLYWVRAFQYLSLTTPNWKAELTRSNRFQATAYRPFHARMDFA